MKYGYVRVSTKEQNIDRLGRNYDMIIDEWRDLVNSLNVDNML